MIQFIKLFFKVMFTLMMTFLLMKIGSMLLKGMVRVLVILMSMPRFTCNSSTRGDRLYGRRHSHLDDWKDQEDWEDCEEHK